MDAARQYERDTGLPAYRKAGAFQGWPTPEYASWLEHRLRMSLSLPAGLIANEPQDYSYAGARLALG